MRDKLGPILWQFPPNFGWNEERFRKFFELLPRDTKAAASIARRHDSKLKHGAFTKSDQSRQLRYSVEIRHPSFMVPEFFALLREFNIAFVFADTAGKWPYCEDLTADFVYCRLHGAEVLYVSGYTDAALDWWASRIRDWRQGKQPKNALLISKQLQNRDRKEVYVYFDNDAKVHAPFDARRLVERL